MIIIKIIDKSNSGNIKGIITLLEHLSDSNKFYNFIAKYYEKYSADEILKSYIWFIASILEKLCNDFIGLEPFLDVPIDSELGEGSVLPIHYTLLCKINLYLEIKKL